MVRLSDYVVDLFVDLIPWLLASGIIWYAYRSHTSNGSQKYKTFWPRFWAPVLDSVVVWPFLVLGPYVLVSLFEFPRDWRVFIFGCAYLSYYPYSIYFHWKYGATIGKMITKIRVVDCHTEREISLKKSVLRDIVPFAIIFGYVGTESSVSSVDNVLLFWFLLEVGTMLLNEKRRALHDFIAGTVVVRSDLNDIERENKPEEDPPSDQS